MSVFCYLSGAPRAGARIEFIEKVSAYEMTVLEKRLSGVILQIKFL